MIPLERRLKILDKVKETGFASINDLTSLLNVSHMTIRRDIQKLEAEGFVVQVSGGIEVCKRLVTEPTQYEKENLAKEQKKKIAKKAVSLIKENSCIYLDAGSTTLAMCKYLDKRSDLTIVSNDFAIMNYLIDNSKATLIHVGGLIRGQNRSSVGHIASLALNALSIDIAFLTAAAWDLRGITTVDTEQILVKKAAYSVSKRRILVSDSSKYGNCATYLALPLVSLNQIITDTSISDVAKKSLPKMGIELTLV